jgi:Tol biopolymer transport system component
VSSRPRLAAAFDTTRPFAVLSLFALPIIAFLVVHAPDPRIPFLERLTNPRGRIGIARFSADGASIVYSAAADEEAERFYALNVVSRVPAPLDPRDPRLRSSSPCGLLGSLRPSTGSTADPGGILRLAPTIECDASSISGEMAVVRRVSTGSRLEFPPGQTIHQSKGEIWTPRVSRSGKKVAFVERGPNGLFRIGVADRKGTIRFWSRPWDFVNGIGWGPDEKEIWFAGGVDWRDTSLNAVTSSSRERQLLPVAGAISLEDVSANGMLIFRLASIRDGLEVDLPGSARLSFLTADRAISIGNPAGGDLVFSDEMWLTKREHAIFPGSGRRNWTVRAHSVSTGRDRLIGKGIGIAASPSGRLVLMKTDDAPATLLLQGVDGTDPIPLRRGALGGFSEGGWFPDEKRIYFDGLDREGTWRVYSQSLDGSDPLPLSDPGATAPKNAVSANARWLVTRTEAGNLRVHDLRGTQTVEMPPPSHDAILAGWDDTGSGLLFAVPDSAGADIVRIGIPDLQRARIGRITKKDPAATFRLTAVNQIGSDLAYSYEQSNESLYLVDGIR